MVPSNSIMLYSVEIMHYLASISAQNYHHTQMFMERSLHLPLLKILFNCSMLHFLHLIQNQQNIKSIDKYTEKTDKNQKKVSQGVQHLQNSSMLTNNRV